jgi:F0F1-type ATP synthase assembly protein I
MADKSSPEMGRRLAQGLEVAVGAGLGYFVGHWLGQRYGWGPWGDFGGVVLGTAAGMYSLIREAVGLSKK